jgi:hypothetical protein
LDFDIDSYQEVVDYIKEDRYNIENINIDNKESFIDDFIIYLVESNQIEILDIINPLFNGAPTFNSLTIIDEKIMKSIMMVIKRYGKRHSHLYLNNIEKIDCETLQILESETKDFTLTSLYLNGLKALALKEFEILSNCKIGQLYMNSISYLPAGAAKHLSNLSGLFKAEIETDKYIEIEQLTKMIVLNGIKEIDVEFSLGFKSFNGTLILDSLEKLNDDLIDLLSNCNENLSIRLSGIKNLDDNKIIAITNFRGADMSIKGLSYISDQAMEYFAKTKYSYLTKIIINSVFHLHRKHFNRLDYIRNQIN